MYITRLEDRYVGGSCVNFISFLSHLSKPVHISWICSWHCYVNNETRRQVCWWFLICSWHCYVYNETRRQVCWWFLYEIVINIVMYITSVFSRCWWYFRRLSCGKLLIFWESAESNPGYVRDIVMYITSLEDRYVGGSCVNFFIFITSL